MLQPALYASVSRIGLHVALACCSPWNLLLLALLTIPWILCLVYHSLRAMMASWLLLIVPQSVWYWFQYQRASQHHRQLSYSYCISLGSLAPQRRSFQIETLVSCLSFGSIYSIDWEHAFCIVPLTTPKLMGRLSVHTGLLSKFYVHMSLAVPQIHGICSSSSVRCVWMLMFRLVQVHHPTSWLLARASMNLLIWLRVLDQMSQQQQKCPTKFRSDWVRLESALDVHKHTRRLTMMASMHRWTFQWASEYCFRLHICVYLQGRS